MPPGSVPDGELALVTHMATGTGATAVMSSGGFDPVPVPARSGDSLRIQIQDRGEPADRTFYAKVPPRRAPTVVRSDPSAQRTDVPLNSRILVVFSEPMSDASLADSSMYLLRNGVPVLGTQSFADSAHLSIAFTPRVPLDGGERYVLRVTTAARDADGEALGGDVEVEFTTRPAPSTSGQTATWRAIAPMPLPLSSAGVAVHNGTVYVLGGWDISANDLQGGESSAILAYDPASNAWRTAGALAHPVLAPGAAVVGDRIYVIGGYNDTEGYVAHVQVFDPASGTVVPGPPLPRAKMSVAAAVVGGRIHVFGGYYNEPETPWEIIQLRDHDVLDPVAGTWSARAPRNRGLVDPGAVVIDGRIYVVPLGEVEQYDAASDSWTSLGTSPQRQGPGVAAMGGAIYIAGGMVQDPAPIWGYSASVLRFDPATRTFEPATGMTLARAYAGLVEVNGILYAMGGAGLPGTHGTSEMFRMAP